LFRILSGGKDGDWRMRTARMENRGRFDITGEGMIADMFESDRQTRNEVRLPSMSKI
jgi:hypothetical protein